MNSEQAATLRKQA